MNVYSFRGNLLSVIAIVTDGQNICDKYMRVKSGFSSLTRYVRNNYSRVKSRALFPCHMAKRIFRKLLA